MKVVTSRLSSAALPLLTALTLLLPGCGEDKDAATNGATGGKATGGSSSGGNSTGGSSSSTAGQANSSAGKGGGSTTPQPGGKSSAADIARKLGRKPNFLIGMGNDLPEDFQWRTPAFTPSVRL